MEMIEELYALGGPSMGAIIATSLLAITIIIYKSFQYVLRGYLRHKDIDHNAIRRARFGLGGLELCATIAPLLGLLGTVLGMIKAFQNLERSGGAPEIAVLAGGIWQALSTTAAGMVVAIIATFFLAIFDGVVAGLEAKLKDQVKNA